MPGGRPRMHPPKYNPLQAMGENIHAIRKHMKMNQTDFGKMFGVGQMTVSYRKEVEKDLVKLEEQYQ